MITDSTSVRMNRRNTENAHIPWTDEELRRSVEVYVLLLRLKLNGAYNRSEPLAQALLSSVLTQRNDAAIRYRMRNISAVVQELGTPILVDFSPAESVGRLVRDRIRAMLLEDADFAHILKPSADGEADATSNALAALHILRCEIKNLERDLALRGHNGPPDREDHSAEHDQLVNALDDIGTIERELEKPSPDKTLVKARSARLLDFATILGKWLGDRVTKFVDAALVAAAPVLIAKATGLLSAVVNAIEAVSKAIGH